MVAARCTPKFTEQEMPQVPTPIGTLLSFAHLCFHSPQDVATCLISDISILAVRLGNNNLTQHLVLEKNDTSQI